MQLKDIKLTLQGDIPAFYRPYVDEDGFEVFDIVENPPPLSIANVEAEITIRFEKGRK